jgi:hypothetical protein
MGNCKWETANGKLQMEMMTMLVSLRRLKVATVWCAMSLSFASARCASDTPLGRPETMRYWSPNKKIVAVSEPGIRTTTLYRKSSTGKLHRLWSMYGWFRFLLVSDDGDHVVIAPDEMNLIPTDYKPDMVMLYFVRRGLLKRCIRLPQIIHDRTALIRTSSHYFWGVPLGFNARNQLETDTVEGKVLMFDPDTGALVGSRTSERDYDSLRPAKQ